MTAPLRVLHCPENVAANAQGLAEAERELGLASRVVAFEPGPFGVHTDEVLGSGGRSVAAREVHRLRLLVRACRDFDVVHFNFGQTIMPFWAPPGTAPPDERAPRLRALWRTYARVVEQRDLPLLKRLGKAIVVTFQGQDARQGDRLAEFAPDVVREVGPSYYNAPADAHKRLRIARFDRYADTIFALNPDLLRVLPARARFLPYSSVDPRQWTPVEARQERPLVVHAPSHRGVKGTRFILETVERLRIEGLEFDFELVENVDRNDARRLYERADVLVDQLLLGWYGGLAVELMALGKPVVCFVRDDDLRFVPPAMRAELPVVRATAATLDGVLRDLLCGPRRDLVELGRRSRAYVEHWHDPRAVAAETKAAYEAALGR